jgi:N-acetylneuraminate synthase
MLQFNPICYKIPSASLTDKNLLLHARETGHPVILSTGMSTMSQIKAAVKVLGEENLLINHATSTYPCDPGELNLKMIRTLVNTFHCPIGYSGRGGSYPKRCRRFDGACDPSGTLPWIAPCGAVTRLRSVEPGGGAPG